MGLGLTDLLIVVAQGDSVRNEGRSHLIGTPFASKPSKGANNDPQGRVSISDSVTASFLSIVLVSPNIRRS